MKLKDAKYKVCKECGSRKEVISDDKYGCDQCKKEINFYSEGKSHNDFLDIKVFHHNNDPTEEFQFCSWKCVFKFLPTIKTNYFVTLPYLHYEDDVMPGQGIKGFLKEIKNKNN